MLVGSHGCIIYFFDYTANALITFHFFFNDTATTEIYTLSLHDALPISRFIDQPRVYYPGIELITDADLSADSDLYLAEDRKSTRLNSSHGYISYAVFCLKKKK